MASNAAIMVDPDKLFGRNLAVLGNTGSGKHEWTAVAHVQPGAQRLLLM